MTAFPMAFVDPIVDALKRGFDAGIVIEPRPLTSVDSHAIGVYPTTWQPVEGSHMIGLVEPSLNNYSIQVSNLLIHGDDIVGRREFAADCRSVRAILYRDEGLRVALGGLTEALFGSVERVMKYNLARQDFLASRLDIGFTYLCTTDVVIQTETTKENP